MKLNVIKFWILATIFIVAGNQNMFAGNTNIRLTVDKNPKVCGNDKDKEFIVFVEMGKVQVNDSLFGFDFQLIYDSKNLGITDFLTIGCLAENCTHKNAVFHGDTVRGYATRMDLNPLRGDRPLFAIKGKVKNNCIDSALIRIDYIEFTQEYTKSVDINDTLYLKAERSSNNQSQITANFKSDSIVVAEDMNEELFQQELNITYNGVQLIDSFILKLTTNVPKIVANEITLDEGMQIQTVNDSTFIIDYSGKPSYAFFKKLKLSIRKDELINSDKMNIFLKAEFIEDKCKCIGKYTNDTLIVKKAKSIVKDEYNRNNAEQVLVFDVLRVNENDKYMKLYDAKGSLVMEQEICRNEINFGVVDNGYYLAIIYDENKQLIKTIKIIKYSFIN